MYVFNPTNALACKLENFTFTFDGEEPYKGPPMLEFDEREDFGGDVYLSSLEPGNETVVITFDQWGYKFYSDPINVTLNEVRISNPPRFNDTLD